MKAIDFLIQKMKQTQAVHGDFATAISLLVFFPRLLFYAHCAHKNPFAIASSRQFELFIFSDFFISILRIQILFEKKRVFKGRLIASTELINSEMKLQLVFLVAFVVLQVNIFISVIKLFVCLSMNCKTIYISGRAILDKLEKIRGFKMKILKSSF